MKTVEKEFVSLTPEAEALAERYIEERVIGPGMRVDAQHIAIATVHRVDVLVSWNFKHIVHYDKIRYFSAVNLELGYRPLTIYSPREVTHHGEDD